MFNNKKTTEVTLCGGTVTHCINTGKQLSVSATFKQITPSADCVNCNFRTFCSELLSFNKEEKKLSEVLLKTFTGMEIGYYPIHVETETYYEIVPKEKEQPLQFSKVTGRQLNAPNPRYANKIDISI